MDLTLTIQNYTATASLAGETHISAEPLITFYLFTMIALHHVHYCFYTLCNQPNLTLILEQELLLFVVKAEVI